MYELLPSLSYQTQRRMYWCCLILNKHSDKHQHQVWCSYQHRFTLKSHHCQKECRIKENKLIGDPTSCISSSYVERPTTCASSWIIRKKKSWASFCPHTFQESINMLQKPLKIALRLAVTHVLASSGHFFTLLNYSTIVFRVQYTPVAHSIAGLL
jgi:hypothetical protein